MQTLKSRIAIACSSLLLAFSAAGCTEDIEHVGVDGTMKSDGYALFSVENGRQQRNDITMTLRDVEPKSTYVLIYSVDPPTNTGWFRFDPNSVQRCGGDIGTHCIVPGYGYLVDVVTVPEGQTEVTLRDDRCGCDADRYERDWLGHWAVMRIERPNKTNPIRFDVWAKAVKSHAEKPELLQLQ